MLPAQGYRTYVLVCCADVAITPLHPLLTPSVTLTHPNSQPLPCLPHIGTLTSLSVCPCQLSFLTFLPHTITLYFFFLACSRPAVVTPRPPSLQLSSLPYLSHPPMPQLPHPATFESLQPSSVPRVGGVCVPPCPVSFSSPEVPQPPCSALSVAGGSPHPPGGSTLPPPALPCPIPCRSSWSHVGAPRVPLSCVQWPRPCPYASLSLHQLAGSPPPSPPPPPVT